MRYRTLNPTTGEELEVHATASDAWVEASLDRAVRAWQAWKSWPLERRADLLRKIAERLRTEADANAELMALEMGKPVAEGLAESEKCALGCLYFADHAADLLRPEPRPSDGSESWVRLEPLGAVLGIMPWNFPFWQVFRFVAPALIGGNAVLLKHAPNTPRCALAIERIVLESGLPEGVLQNLFLTNDQVARAIGDPRVRGVTLTGSTRAGRQVAAEAGRHLKTMVMELGGSDPFLVFDDADLDRAVEVAVTARCLNSGQSCIAAKRFLIQQPVFEDFRDRFVDAMGRQTVGDPRDAGTQIGPLARQDLRSTLTDQVSASIAAGARALCGGRPADGPGFFYPPTVLVDAPAGSPAAAEELFGPVASLAPFDDEEQGVALANATSYGLGASIWTADAGRARRLVPRLEAGSVFVNGLVKSDPRLPFGGVKDSGFGRELSAEGLRAFLNIKTVWIA